MLINPYAKTAGGGGGGSDPYFADVVLLCHFDVDMSDSSSFGTVMNAHSTSINTTGGVPKFGAGCLDCGHFGGYAVSNVIGSGDPLDLSTGDYTIEGWINATSPNGDAIFGTGGYFGSTPMTATCNSSHNLQALVDNVFVAATAGAFTGATYHHLAITRASNMVTGWLDGVGGTPVAVTPLSWVGAVFGLGGTAAMGGANYFGTMDEIRVTKGVARYTSNFTPPSAAFPDS